jgi:pilus assembly protein CpaF
VSADALMVVRQQLSEQLRQRVDARGLAAASRTERRVRVREEALELLRASGVILPQRELTRMVNEVSDEVVGFGPIEFLLKEPDVTEVMVNGPDDVYVERGGRIERALDGLFEGEEAVLHLIERIVGPLGLRVDESSPWADARLPDGSRVHAERPNLQLKG